MVPTGKLKYFTRGTGNPRISTSAFTLLDLTVTFDTDDRFWRTGLFLLSLTLFSLTSVTPPQASSRATPDSVYELSQIVSGHRLLALVAS